MATQYKDHAIVIISSDVYMIHEWSSHSRQRYSARISFSSRIIIELGVFSDWKDIYEGTLAHGICIDVYRHEIRNCARLTHSQAFSLERNIDITQALDYLQAVEECYGSILHLPLAFGTEQHSSISFLV